MRILILLLFFSYNASSQCGGVRRIITQSFPPYGGFYFPTSFTWGNTDTFIIRKQDHWANMIAQFTEFHGQSKECPLVIMNDVLDDSISTVQFTNCTFIKFTGEGTGPGTEGFEIVGGFTAIDVDGRSADIEACYVKTYRSGYIMRAKQDRSAYDSLNYPNWRMNNINVHDIISINVNQDGIYFGNTSPVSGPPYPMRLSNIKIHDLWMDSLGRTGIQLSGCDSGFNEIYSNFIRHTGYELNHEQGPGGIIGGMAKNVRMRNNKSRQTFQAGFRSFGTGTNWIEYNDIDSSAIIEILEGKSNLTNTDTTAKFIHAGGDLPSYEVLEFIVTGLKFTGTPAGTAQVFAAKNATPTTFVPVSTVYNITNTASQTKKWTITGADINYQYFKIVVKTTGAQSSTWKGAIGNPGYDFSIDFDTKPIYPALLDSTVIYIRNNICDDSDYASIATGSNIDSWKQDSASVIGCNIKQNGLPASIYDNGAPNFTFRMIPCIPTVPPVFYFWKIKKHRRKVLININ